MLPRSVYMRRRILLGLAAAALLTLLIFGLRSGVCAIQNWRTYSAWQETTGFLKSGQTLFDSLTEKGLSRKTANELLFSIGKVLDLRKLRVNDNYTFYLDKEGLLQKFVYEKSPIDQYFAVRDKSSGELVSFVPGIFPERREEVKEFTIKASLFGAMKDKGEEDALVFLFVDIFAWDIDFFTYPRVGDKIKIYFEKYYHNGKFVKYGRIMAAEYQGREKFQAVYFEPAGKRGAYYHLDGSPSAKMFLKSPLKFTGRITSLFGSRVDPITSRHGTHRGVDFASYYGAPIVATAGGVVDYSGWKGPYGQLVILRHANGYSTRYGHCSRLLVRRGQRVSQGQIIAKVGSTGHSTGPHCHYEVRLNNVASNPLRFKQPKVNPLKGKELETFKKLAREVWPKIGKIN